MRIVVGLGNPGPAYASTRHNLGVRLIERVAERMGVRLRRGKGPWVEGETGSGAEMLVLARPTTYMNVSGPPVGALARARGAEASDLLVACDDFYLPLGRMRLRPGGGNGGHKGLASVAAALGTSGFPRLRLGIGEPPSGEEGAEWVLRAFEGEERETVEEMLDRAATVIEVLAGEGLHKAMELANRRPEGSGRGGESVGTSL